MLKGFSLKFGVNSSKSMVLSKKKKNDRIVPEAARQVLLGGGNILIMEDLATGKSTKKNLDPREESETRRNKFSESVYEKFLSQPITEHTVARGSGTPSILVLFFCFCFFFSYPHLGKIIKQRSSLRTSLTRMK